MLPGMTLTSFARLSIPRGSGRPRWDVLVDWILRRWRRRRQVAASTRLFIPGDAKPDDMLVVIHWGGDGKQEAWTRVVSDPTWTPAGRLFGTGEPRRVGPKLSHQARLGWGPLSPDDLGNGGTA
jgi:hypothetical protein